MQKISIDARVAGHVDHPQPLPLGTSVDFELDAAGPAAAETQVKFG
jgi:hypothetical protein